jgi:hypothetical protein
MPSQIHYGDEDKICAVSVARRVAGPDAAKLIRDVFGGTTIYIPRTIKSDHELSLLIGWPAARAIAAEIGGVPTDVPFGNSRIVNMEHVVLWATLAGLTARKIACLVDRTDRHVRHIRLTLRKLGKLPQVGGAHV